jgi:hypothetical protein
VRKNLSEPSLHSRGQSVLLASARLSTVVGESNGLIVVITDGEGSGVPVAQEAKGIQ